jgi:hypothetical protein
LLLKRDDSLKSAIQEGVTRIPLNASGSVSIAASGTGTATISVPDGEMWFIKSWAITKGADVTISSIEIDGSDTGQIDSLTDTLPEYGALLTANRSLTVTGSNAGLSAEDLQIDVKGYLLR